MVRTPQATVDPLDSLLNGQQLTGETPGEAVERLYPRDSRPEPALLWPETVPQDMPFDGTPNPKRTIIREKPEHMTILVLKAQGMTNRQIAHRTGYQESWISQLTRQPWFQKRLLDEFRRVSESTDLFGFMQAQLEQSLITLCDLRDNAASEQVRASCAVNLIDRVLGKPVARSEVRVDVAKVEDRVRSIDAILSELEQEEKRVVGEAKSGAGEDGPTSASPAPLQLPAPTSA